MLHSIVYSMVMTMHHILRLFNEVRLKTGVWLSKMPSGGKTITGRKSQLGASGQDTVSNHKAISKKEVVGTRDPSATTRLSYQVGRALDLGVRV